MTKIIAGTLRLLIGAECFVFESAALCSRSSCGNAKQPYDNPIEARPEEPEAAPPTILGRSAEGRRSPKQRPLHVGDRTHESSQVVSAFRPKQTFVCQSSFGLSGLRCPVLFLAARDDLERIVRQGPLQFTRLLRVHGKP